MKVRSLGYVASQARGLTMSTATNATPSVATIAPSANHRLRNGDRIAVAGVTGLTAINGEWTVGSVGDTAATLLGSKGNGAFGGTAVVAVLCDATPFTHHNTVGVAIQNGGTVLSGTVIIEGADQIKSDGSEFGYTSSGAYASGFTSAMKSGERAMTVAGEMFEVDLFRYMTFRCSAYTSGNAFASMFG